MTNLFCWQRSVLVEAMVFPVVMYGFESWSIKKAECQRIDALELRCWRRLLRVPWTARRWSQSILNEINPDYSMEKLMLKLKFQYFGHLMQRTVSLEKTLMLRTIEARRRRGWQRMRWLDGIIDSTDMNLSKLRETVRQGSLVYCSPWGCKESEWLNDWTTTAMRFLKALAIYWQYGAIVSLSPPPTHAYTYSCYTVGSY